MEFTTEENGAKVVICAAPLMEAFNLKSLIQKALLTNNIKLEEALDNDIFSILMALDSSPEIFEAMFKCLEKSTYNNIKITKETFEPEQARADLYEVFYYCLKVNVYPFFKSLLSKFGSGFMMAPHEEDPK